MGIEDDIRHIKERQIDMDRLLLGIHSKLDKLLAEKAPRDRSKEEKETKEALKLNDGEDVTEDKNQRL